MKNEIFRPVEFWKESLTTLPENAFFELLRTVLGKIKTPFNKQILIADLEKFLSRNDIQKNIACFIDRNDARIICAVAALNEPSPQDMEAFFSGDQLDDIGPGELHDWIVNLEERFILYRFFENEQSHLALNPVLEPVLLPVATDRTILFQSFSPDEIFSDGMPHNVTPENNFVLDDRILAALFSFISQTEPFYKKMGDIRQKIVNEINTTFPGMPVEAIIGGLRVLGLLTKDGEHLLPDYSRFSDFAGLNRRERMEYCTAGIYYFCHISIGYSFSSRLLRSKVSDMAKFIHRFIDSVDSQRLYSTATLRRIVYILHRDGSDVFFRAFADSLEKTGLLVPVSPGALQGGGSRPGLYWRMRLPPGAEPSMATTQNSASETPVIAMDTPYSFLVYPEIAYNDVMTLASFSHVIKADATVRFELNRDCTTWALNRGISTDTMIELLQRLSHNRIDENLIFTLHDWEKRHNEVRLLNGIVLTLSPERRYLAETKPLAALITETLAPGVYLLPPTAKDGAVTALRQAGVTVLNDRSNNKTGFEDNNESSNAIRYNFYPHLHSGMLNAAGISNAEDTVFQNRQGLYRALLPADDGHEAVSASTLSASALIEDFHSILEKMKLGREEHDALTARIDRRLILCESQLKDAVIRYEKLEARGLDYTGKVMIAKQAISLQAPVEVHLSGRKGERVFGIPRALEKVQGESVLVVEQADKKNNSETGYFQFNEPQDTSGNTIRIPLGKISLLRRIKKSIFENDII